MAQNIYLQAIGLRRELLNCALWAYVFSKKELLGEVRFINA